MRIKFQFAFNNYAFVSRESINTEQIVANIVGYHFGKSKNVVNKITDMSFSCIYSCADFPVSSFARSPKCFGDRLSWSAQYETEGNPRVCSFSDWK
nr:hypothetical protein [Mucilaginibacter sp. SP1R1]